MPPIRVLQSLAAAMLACAVLAGCNGQAEETPGKEAEGKAPAQANIRTVRVATVEQRLLEGGLAASGVLISREEAAVNAEVSGYRVARVMADVGDRVSAGQPLVVLDDVLLRAQIDQQTAAVAQADVAARQADAQAARVADLKGQGVIADEQIEQRQFQAETARAQLAAQRAALNDLRTRQSKMTVRAPVSGMVLERLVRPGDLSGATTGPMFRIARDGAIELQAQLAEGAMATIRPGQAVDVTLPGGQTLQGVVRLIEPNVDPATKLGAVRVRLPSHPQVRAGGFARAVFTSAAAPALSVPEGALRYDADGVSVMVVDEGNRVREVPVRAGRRGGGYVELEQGPPAGSKVLLGSSSFVLEGDVVRPIESASAAAPAVQPKPAAPPATGKTPGGR